VRQRLGFEPDETQRRLLESRSKRVVVNCARQWGKSTTTAAKAVHHAFTEAESLTLVVSPSARQSGEFVRGVGAPVVDMLRPRERGLPDLAGDYYGRRDRAERGRHCSVPKRDLIVGVQVVLQRGELQIAAGLEHSATLVEEMAGMRVRVTPSGHEQYAAWREGEHDDMVLAVALACWGVRKVHPGGRVADEYWGG